MSRAATCASASDPGRARRPRAAAAALACALALAGCIAAIRAAGTGRAFDHGAHAKRDLDCTDCHEGAKSEARAGLPTLETCAMCHDPETDRREFAAEPRPASYADVKFDHARHAAKGIDCAKCHAGAATGPIPNPAGPISMAECMACHAASGAKSDCATCHTTLGKTAQPRNHAGGWMLHHGPISRLPGDGAAERCDLCHARADCDSCHAANAPRDHGNAWRVATHGLSAAMDRERCTTCHEADSCVRCHSVAPPRSHRAGFGAPQNRHCVSCHLPSGPAGGTSCGTCHAGTPSHAAATPKPPTSAHAAARPPGDCLACHRAVPHPTGGEDCNQCHR